MGKRRTNRVRYGSARRFEIGDRLRDLYGTVGRIVEVTPDHPGPDWIVIVVEESRYNAPGTRLAMRDHSMLRRWSSARRKFVQVPIRASDG